MVPTAKMMVPELLDPQEMLRRARETATGAEKVKQLATAFAASEVEAKRRQDLITPAGAESKPTSTHGSGAATPLRMKALTPPAATTPPLTSGSPSAGVPVVVPRVHFDNLVKEIQQARAAEPATMVVAPGAPQGFQA